MIFLNISIHISNIKKKHEHTGKKTNVKSICFDCFVHFKLINPDTNSLKLTLTELWRI